ncbi:MAG: trigger factor [Bacilli bacterium]|nr:trigger factor [Bacilli bacterium]
MAKEKKTEKEETKKTKTKKEETEAKSVKKTNKHEVNVRIEGKEWQDALDEAFQKRQKTVKVDGFRQGKVPRSVFEKKFGKESLYLEAADIVLPAAYTKAMLDSKLEPIVQPSVDLKSVEADGIEFIFKIVTKPEVTIKKYKGLNIKPDKVEVTDEEIDHEIGHLLERYTELVTKDGKVENGNVAIIDFEGFKDGVAFEGGKGENYSLEIGSNTFIPGFEEKIIGMKVGEEKDLDLTFPENYGVEDLAGAPVVFKVKVNEIKEKQARELDKDFFEDLAMDGVTDEKTLRSEIKSSLSAQKELEVENKYVDELLDAVGKNVEVDIPEELVNEEIDRLMKRFEEQMKMQGISLGVYYQFTGTTEEDLRSQMETEAFKNVLYRLMLEKIMTEEKVEVSEEEVDKEVKELADKYQMSEEDFLKQFGGREFVKYDLEVRKTVDLLKDYNK